MASDTWSRVGFKTVVKRPVTAIAWIVLPLVGGWAIRTYGASLTSDASFLLGLFLLIAQGILSYDLMLRNTTLDLVATIPAPTSAVRQAFRVQGLLVLGSLFVAGLLALSGSKLNDPISWTGFIHIVLPLWVGVPVYCASLCWLAKGTLAPDKEKTVGDKLGQNLLPPDAATLIYGLSLVYGVLGAYSLVLHFTLRAWLDTGNATALLFIGSVGCLTSIAAVFWIDKTGIKNIHQASAHMRHLDKNGLLLATPNQKAAARIVKGTSQPNAWTLVAPQILRRSPLEPVFLLAFVFASINHSSDQLWQALMFPIALGFWLDIPGRWERDRLVTTQGLSLLGSQINTRKSVIRTPALIIILIIGIIHASAIWLMGAGLERGIILTTTMFVAALTSGLLFHRSFRQSWGALRFPSLVILTSLGIFGGMVGS